MFGKKNKDENLSDYQKKYRKFKHHAWAGSVILAILLAIRVFFETANIKFDDRIIILIGGILVVYTLISVIFTYRYSSGLSADSEEKIVHIHDSSENEVEKEKIKAETEKERLKLEKKKAKALAKAAKKMAKAKSKKEKKAEKDKD